MKKKYIAVLITLIFFVQKLPAPEPISCCYAGGNCYQECRTAPCVGPAVALAAIALAAIIAVALIHSNNHAHAH